MFKIFSFIENLNSKFDYSSNEKQSKYVQKLKTRDVEIFHLNESLKPKQRGNKEETEFCKASFKDEEIQSQPDVPQKRNNVNGRGSTRSIFSKLDVDNRKSQVLKNLGRNQSNFQKNTTTNIESFFCVNCEEFVAFNKIDGHSKSCVGNIENGKSQENIVERPNEKILQLKRVDPFTNIFFLNRKSNFKLG